MDIAELRHTRIQFETELGELRARPLTMGTLVHGQIAAATEFRHMDHEGSPRAAA